MSVKYLPLSFSFLHTVGAAVFVGRAVHDASGSTVESETAVGVAAGKAVQEALAALSAGDAASLMSTMTVASSAAAVDPASGASEEFLAASSSFSKASGKDDTPEEKKIARVMGEAVASGSATSTPIRQVLPRADPVCIPDMSSCPVGWELRGLLCFAGSDYSGPCSKELSISDRTRESKIAMSRACRLQWPCRESCPEDFLSLCPEGWEETRPGICQGPSGGVDCPLEIHADSMSVKEKSIFSTRCRARWPCVGVQQHDYASPCPVGWDAKASACYPPAAMKSCGPAPLTMTLREKQHLEASCGATWPAVEQCQKEYGSACPEGWIVRDSSCVAPPGYSKCEGVQDFGGWTYTQKSAWETSCDVSWPCHRGSTTGSTGFLS